MSDRSKKSQHRIRTHACSIAALLACLALSPAHATEGYFQNGYGARHKALAGAGAADGRDATAASLNPAGIVRAGNEIDVSAGLFSPNRQVEGGGQPGFTPTGVVESDRNYFVVPNIARNWKLSGNPWADALTLTMYGNGGMNTSYPAIANPSCGGGVGVFCGGRAGVDLQQMMLSVAVAKRFGNVSVGVAPILAIQRFEAYGLTQFTGASGNGANMTDRGKDTALGGGLKAGIEWAISPSVRVGLTGTTPIWSQKFDKYSGLFAEGGDFDIPAHVQAGVAIDVMPNLTVMLDYKHIWYSSVASVGNPSANILTGNPFGSANGPGFGWKDVDAIKLAVEWRASDVMTLRGGVSYNTQPVQSADAMLNILAPGVTQLHVTGGFQYKLTPNMDLEVAGMYAPRTHVKGGELGPPVPGGFGNPGHTVDISMSQIEITAGIKYKFGP